MTNAQVEQDLIISRAMVDLFVHPDLKGQLAMRGGTAMHKLYLAPAMRYSEDIDLVQTQAGPIREHSLNCAPRLTHGQALRSWRAR